MFFCCCSMYNYQLMGSNNFKSKVTSHHNHQHFLKSYLKTECFSSSRQTLNISYITLTLRNKICPNMSATVL